MDCSQSLPRVPVLGKESVGRSQLVSSITGEDTHLAGPKAVTGVFRIFTGEPVGKGRNTKGEDVSAMCQPSVRNAR